MLTSLSMYFTQCRHQYPDTNFFGGFELYFNSTFICVLCTEWRNIPQILSFETYCVVCCNINECKIHRDIFCNSVKTRTFRCCPLIITWAVPLCVQDGRYYFFHFSSGNCQFFFPIRFSLKYVSCRCQWNITTVQ